METYRADVDMLVVTGGPAGAWSAAVLPGSSVESWCVSEEIPNATVHKACRCFRCGDLLTAKTLVVDRIIPGCDGGTYRRNNIRPECHSCSATRGGAVRRKPASKPKNRKPVPPPW